MSSDLDTQLTLYPTAKKGEKIKGKKNKKRMRKMKKKIMIERREKINEISSISPDIQSYIENKYLNAVFCGVFAMDGDNSYQSRLHHEIIRNVMIFKAWNIYDIEVNMIWALNFVTRFVIIIFSVLISLQVLYPQDPTNICGDSPLSLFDTPDKCSLRNVQVSFLAKRSCWWYSKDPSIIITNRCLTMNSERNGLVVFVVCLLSCAFSIVFMYCIKPLFDILDTEARSANKVVPMNTSTLSPSDSLDRNVSDDPPSIPEEHESDLEQLKDMSSFEKDSCSEVIQVEESTSPVAELCDDDITNIENMSNTAIVGAMESVASLAILSRKSMAEAISSLSVDDATRSVAGLLSMKCKLRLEQLHFYYFIWFLSSLLFLFSC